MSAQRARTLNPDDLRKMIEMAIAGVQGEIVLENESGDPQVVRRDGRALSSELPEDRGVMVRRLRVGKQHLDARLHEKSVERPFVFRTAATQGESGS